MWGRIEGNGIEGFLVDDVFLVVGEENTAGRHQDLLIEEVAVICLILATVALESAGSAGCPWSFPRCR